MACELIETATDYLRATAHFPSSGELSKMNSSMVVLLLLHLSTYIIMFLTGQDTQDHEDAIIQGAMDSDQMAFPNAWMS